MKRISILLFSVFLSLSALAQKNLDNTLKFLGIPVDGSEQAMRTKLKQKGFKEHFSGDYLTGQFNGQPVEIWISTNHKIVDRIFVAFPNTTEREICFEFNNLLQQFRENEKYSEFLVENQRIPSNENISYEMAVNNKKYQAGFSYINPDIEYNEGTLKEQFYQSLYPIMSEDEITKLRSLLMNGSGKDRALTFADFVNKMGEKIDEVKEDIPSEALNEILLVCNKILSIIDSMQKGKVWFQICEDNNRYFIGLYYDNLSNRPNGEDL